MHSNIKPEVFFSKEQYLPTEAWAPASHELNPETTHELPAGLGFLYLTTASSRTIGQF
jgi:hypothetical protein